MNEADLVLLGLVQVDSTDSVPIALIGEKVGTPLCLLINYDAKISLRFRKERRRRNPESTSYGEVKIGPLETNLTCRPVSNGDNYKPSLRLLLG
jgi:hypothetical protein